MRIVHVANAYTASSGGIRTTVHALGLGYRAAGHELVLVVPGAVPRDEVLPWGRRITLRGPVVPLSGGYRVLTDLVRVTAVLDALAPDRLEVSDRLTLRRLGTWSARAGVPSVLLLHERLDGVLRAFGHLPPDVARRVADRHNRETAEQFDTLVATSAFAAAEVERLGITTTRIALGVDLSRFTPRPDRRDPGGGPLLVLCSRLSREKRPDLAVEVVRELHRHGFPARLVVAGTGPLARSLRRRSAGLPVQLLGHVDDHALVATLLGTADVVLAPGPIETFGLAALEALACGTPVVAASGSAVAELLDGMEGRSARPSPDALAAAVLGVLATSERARRAAARARAETFPWSRTVERMLDLHRGADRSTSPC